MTMKTKRGLAVGGGTALCAALAVLITMRFAPDNKPTADSTSTSSSTSQISAEVTASKHEETKPAEQDNSSVSSQLENDEPKTNEPEKDNVDESSVTEVVQNFPEPEKENVPPAPPKIEDEKILTNPDAEPSYEPEQTEVKPQETPSDTPKHGDKKDGKIYINGFGWVKDEGGGGEGESAPDMFENGNKIGYFG